MMNMQIGGEGGVGSVFWAGHVGGTLWGSGYSGCACERVVGFMGFIVGILGRGGGEVEDCGGDDGQKERPWTDGRLVCSERRASG